MQFDWAIQKGSRISRLPKPLQSAAVVARNLAIQANRKVRPMRNYLFDYLGDGIATSHNVGFMETPGFRRASDRAAKASGRDYGLHYRVHQVLWCSHQAQKVAGDFVELGTGRGYMMSALLADFPDWSKSGRRMHLFDTFLSTHPDESGKQNADGKVSPYYATSLDEVKNNFAEWPRVHFHVGDVFDELPKAELSSIAFVHIDLNYYKPEIFGLRSLWPHMPRGAVVLLDDYACGNFGRQYAAMNELSDELGFRILSTASGQGIIVK